MSDQSNTKVSSAHHVNNAMAACATVAELDAFKATLAPGALNSSWWEQYGRYFARDILKGYADRRVVLGGARPSGVPD